MLLSSSELELVGKIAAIIQLVSLDVWCQSALSKRLAVLTACTLRRKKSFVLSCKHGKLLTTFADSEVGAGQCGNFAFSY